MSLLRPYNDLHNEFTVFNIPESSTDKETILSLAGDIYTRKHLLEWLRPLSARFKAIVVVLGNHDYWNGDVDKFPITIQQWLRDNGINNIYHLNNNSVELDEVVFFGGTLWTDFNRQDPLTMISYAPFRDFKKIRTENYMKKWSPKTALLHHSRFIINLKNTLADPNNAGKKFVVVSHMAPCSLSLDPKYANDRVHNGFYYSDQSNLILDHPQIKLWHHGHIHYKSDYMLGDNCRIINNPRGYTPMEPVYNFDPLMNVDLSSI